VYQPNRRSIVGMYTIRKPIAERFKGKYEVVESGCWEWQAHVTRYGYGLLKNDQDDGPRMVFAHRASWQIHHGKIPFGLFVLHKCDNRKCVNPNHLFLGTKKDNSDDRDRKKRQACGAKNGNAKYTEADILRIYDMRDAGMSNTEIARAISGSRITVWEVVTGRKWRYLFAQRYAA
jgi:hypothetical protein